MELSSIFENALQAKPILACSSEEERNTLLETIATQILQDCSAILAANQKDIETAKGQISDVMLDRLLLTPERISAMASGIREVIALQSPIGHIESEITRPNGLLIKKVRVPIGVIAIIYESRPNVTTDAAALCIKSGNVCILRGGSDAICTNIAIMQSVQTAIALCKMPLGTVQLVEDTTHKSSAQIMQARGTVDLLIPRGGKNLIRAVVEGAKGVPVVETGSGICHIYVDKDANIDMAMSILYNAKTSRPSVCNAAEVCLVHKDIAAKFLPCAQKLLAEKQVELRLDDRASIIIDGEHASVEDFDCEFLDYVLAVALVDSTEDAIAHIRLHSSGHSEAIITDNLETANQFLQQVDSAAVYHNASTRFTDGNEFGLGCEMGISTQKLGARGPMGLYELTSYKYIIEGNGQIR